MQIYLFSGSFPSNNILYGIIIISSLPHALKNETPHIGSSVIKGNSNGPKTGISTYGYNG